MPRILDAPLTAYILPAFLLLTAIGFLLLAGTFDLQSRMIPLLIGRTMFALATLDRLPDMVRRVRLDAAFPAGVIKARR